MGKELGKKPRELVKMEKRPMAEAAETRALPSACPGYIFFQPLNAGELGKLEQVIRGQSVPICASHRGGSGLGSTAPL